MIIAIFTMWFLIRPLDDPTAWGWFVMHGFATKEACLEERTRHEFFYPTMLCVPSR